MDATAEMNAIGTVGRQSLPPLQIGPSGQPISLTDQVVSSLITAVLVGLIVAFIQS